MGKTTTSTTSTTSTMAATRTTTTTTTTTTTATHPSSGKDSVDHTQRYIADPNKLQLKIYDHWYDLTQWQQVHPGGASVLQHLNGQDATDAFESLHSKEAHERLRKLKSLSTPAKAGQVPPPSAVALSFRKFRAQLEADGHFERSLVWEIFYPGHIFLLCALGSYAATLHYTTLAIVLIGLGMQQAGWVGHDYVHGRGPQQLFCGRIMSGFINAFSPSWWSQKHNTHHVYTNHLDIDLDIQNDPIIHLITPDPSSDVWFRRYQHLYFPFIASFLFVSWRIQSFQQAVRMWSKNSSELLLMLPNYTWLMWLGPTVALGSVLLAGFLVAVIVTATHQSEEMFVLDSQTYSYVECQFRTTRDAYCADPLMEWLWGGMQYQLEHHLFPVMPKYNYPRVRPLVAKWASENGIEYRIDSVYQIWQRNYEMLKRIALAKAV